jgi:hypothetical protein
MIQDYFVGFLSAACGGFLLAGALLDAAWLLEMRRPRLLAESIGRTATRWTLGVLGVALIAIGGVIASGWRVDWSWLGQPAKTQRHVRGSGVFVANDFPC